MPRIVTSMPPTRPTPNCELAFYTQTEVDNLFQAVSADLEAKCPKMLTTQPWYLDDEEKDIVYDTFWSHFKHYPSPADTSPYHRVNTTKFMLNAFEYRSEDPDFHQGLQTFADAASFARTGWEEGAEKLHNLSEKLRPHLPSPQSIRRRRRWTDIDGGAEPDAERFAIHDLDRMVSVTRRVRGTGTGIVHIAFLWGANCNVKGDTMFWAPAAALAVCRLLEQQGYSVRISAIKSTIWDDGHGAVSVVEVKPEGGNFDVSKLALYCHGGYYRRMGFMLCCNLHMHQQDGGLGHSARTHEMPAMCDMLTSSDVPLRPTYIFPATTHVRNEEEAIQAAIAAVTVIRAGKKHLLSYNV